MNILSGNIVPFYGTDMFTLYMTLNDVKKVLKNAGISYQFEIWPNNGCSPEVPWQIIKVKNVMTMFFAKERLFKISFQRDYMGGLNNGISIGILIDDAKKIDSKLSYNDDNEDYESENGYWVEVNPDTQTINLISIFIKEVLDEDIFFSYEWCEII